MERDFCERVLLICPGCSQRLRIGEVSLVDSLGRIVHGTLACDCPREHPLIDRVPIVVPDLLAYLASEGGAIRQRRDLPEWANDLFRLAADDANDDWRARSLAISSHESASGRAGEGRFPLSSKVLANSGKLPQIHRPLFSHGRSR